MRAVLAIWVLLALPAQAQQVDERRVHDCFGDAAIGETMPSCLGQAAGACQQQGFSSTMGIVECIEGETRVWDDLLNREYGLVRAAFKARPAGAIDLDVKLVQAQRAWVAYRDAECDLAYARWQDGSIRSVVLANCMMQMTAIRAIELRDMKGN